MKLGNRKSDPLRRQRFGRRLGAEILEPRTLLASLPIITEFQAINRATILDEDGDSSDWVEISNPTAETIDLDGWYLTDDAANLNKWKFPSTAINPGEAIIVFASGKNRTESAELHTNFRLSGNGEFLALVRTDGTTVAQDFGV